MEKIGMIQNSIGEKREFWFPHIMDNHPTLEEYCLKREKIV